MNIYLPWWMGPILIGLVLVLGCLYIFRSFISGAVIGLRKNKSTDAKKPEKTPEEKKEETRTAIIGMAVVIVLILFVMLISRGCGTKYMEAHPTGYTIGEVYSCCGGSLELESVNAISDPGKHDLPDANGQWVSVTFSKTGGSDMKNSEIKEWFYEGNLTLEGVTASSIDMSSPKSIIAYFDIDKDVKFYDAKLVAKE